MVLATFKQLVHNYGVDGIHLDDLRFPDAESCQCPACRAALGLAAPEMDWPLGFSLEDKPKARRAWQDYRADLIRNLTETLAGGGRELDDHLVISAALWPEVAVNSDGVRTYGQSYEELGPLLDFIVPMAYHRREDQPIAWVKAVQLSGQWRAGSTPVWIGIEAFEEPGRPASSLGEFGSLLEVVRHGSDGVAFTPTPRCSPWPSRATAGTTCPPELPTWSGVGARAIGSDLRPAPSPRPGARPLWFQPEGPARALRRRAALSPGEWVLTGSGFAVAVPLLVLWLRDRRRARLGTPGPPALGAREPRGPTHPPRRPDYLHHPESPAITCRRG